ncbi:STAS domain-containing protein [Streptomyces sp. NPDC055189]
MDRLTIRESVSDNPPFLTLVLSGELDVVNVGKLSDTVVYELEAGQRHLLIDLTGVTWCDMGSLFTLLGMRHAADHAGGSLSLTAASACVHEALGLARLAELLPCVERR